MDFKIDMHNHIFSFDAQVDNIKEMLLRAKDKGLDGLVVTDHNSFLISEPFEMYKDFALENELYLFRGIEISTDIGHMLAYGIENDSWNTWKKGQSYLDGRRLLKKLSKKGFIAAAHPGIGILKYLAEEDIGELEGLHGLEVFNAGITFKQNWRALKLARKFTQFKSIGGSDSHTGKRVGNAYTVFDKPIHDLDELVHELKYGIYFPVLKGCHK